MKAPTEPNTSYGKLCLRNLMIAQFELHACMAAAERVGLDFWWEQLKHRERDFVFVYSLNAIVFLLQYCCDEHFDDVDDFKFES